VTVTVAPGSVALVASVTRPLFSRVFPGLEGAGRTRTISKKTAAHGMKLTEVHFRSISTSLRPKASGPPGCQRSSRVTPGRGESAGIRSAIAVGDNRSADCVHIGPARRNHRSDHA